MLGFREITIDDAEIIINWRTQERVTKYMKSDVEYNIQNQEQWILSHNNSDDSYHWIITINGGGGGVDIDIGYISMKLLDIEEKKVAHGFYIGDEKYIGMGGIALLYFYNLVFNQLNNNMIYGYAVETNYHAIRIFKQIGWVANSYDDISIIKNGKEIKLLNMVLNKNVFNSNKFNNKFITKFPVGESQMFKKYFSNYCDVL